MPSPQRSAGDPRRGSAAQLGVADAAGALAARAGRRRARRRRRRGCPRYRRQHPSQLPPAAIVSATPQQPPSVPELAPIAPPPAPATPALTQNRAAAHGRRHDRRDARCCRRGPARPGADHPDRGTLQGTPGVDAAAARRPRHRLYSPAGAGADPLGGYHDALERAKGIAKVLTEAGIPEKMIQTEAKPAAGADRRGAGRDSIPALRMDPSPRCSQP